MLPGGVFMGPGPARRLAGAANSMRWLARYRRARVLRRKVRTAFVFAGGGARGSAQIGMLQALVARGITADAVYGASVGAINAAGYCGQPTAAGVDRLAERWRAITREDVFPQGRFPTPWRFFQQREAVHPNDGIRKVIESGLLFERLEDSPIPLEVVATSLTDGRMQWFSEGPAVERIQASAALPALLPPSTSTARRSSTVASWTTSPSAGPSPRGPSASSCCCAAHCTTRRTATGAPSKACSRRSSSPSTPGSPASSNACPRGSRWSCSPWTPSPCPATTTSRPPTR